MEETKPVQVVMLPTKDNTNIYHHKLSGKISWTEVNLKIRHARISQHLYFISNDLIKKHDYYLESRYEREPFIDQADDSWKDDETDSLFGKNPEGTFKVIATTDPSLGLPAVPTAWIRDVYVPSNGSIKEVRLSMEQYAVNTYGLSHDGEPDIDFRLKLTQDNEVVIVDEPNILEMTLKATTLSDDFVDQELEDAAKEHIDAKMGGSKYRLESPNDAYMTARMQSFKDGATWKAEQSANDAIEMLQWICENGWWSSEPMWCNGEDEHYTEITSKQLYELWQQSKKK